MNHKMDGRNTQKIRLKAKCKHCEKSFFNDQILSLHVKSVHKTQSGDSVDKKFMCSKCNRNCSSKSDLKMHFSAVHDKSKKTLYVIPAIRYFLSNIV